MRQRNVGGSSAAMTTATGKRRSSIEQKWCDRLRAAQQSSGISQAKMAKEMSKLLGSTWRQSRVWKLLWCEMPVTISVFDAAVKTLGMTLEDFVLGARAGTGDYLDEYEKKLIYTLRRTQTSDYICRAVALLAAEANPADNRAQNPGRPRKAAQQDASRTA